MNAVDVVNNALREIGQSSDLTSLEPNQDYIHASACARAYQQCWEYILSQHPWSFAIKEIDGEKIANTQYDYLVPPDIVRLINITHKNGERADYTRFNKFIRCLSSAIRIQYIGKDTDVSNAPTYVVYPLIEMIKSNIVGEIVRGEDAAKLSAQFKQVAFQLIQNAIKIHTSECAVSNYGRRLRYD